MLVVVSPAKRLDWSPKTVAMTEPAFQDQANILAGHARQLTLAKLKSLMSLSDDLARLNRDRFRAFAPQSTAANALPALHAFAGDTYQGFDAASMDDETARHADGHLRILSGLYGVLRPRDGIQPYRLEMGSRLKSRRGSNLYAFWGDRIAKALNAAAEEIGSDTLLNCASQEYFGAVDREALKLTVLTPEFYEVGPAGPKMISFYAKRARGALARYVMDTRASTREALAGFDRDGYALQAAESDDTRLVFYREAEARAAS